jgi:hypothetical protein
VLCSETGFKQIHHTKDNPSSELGVRLRAYGCVAHSGCVAIDHIEASRLCRSTLSKNNGGVAVLRVALISVNGRPLETPVAACFGEAGGGIGRDERNQLTLPDPERRLSRVQALVHFERNHFCLIDQGATPTVVNGIPLTKGSSLRLHDGDVIDAAGFRMRVEIPGSQPDKRRGAADASPPFDLGRSLVPWGVTSLDVEGQDDSGLSSDPFDELLCNARDRSLSEQELKARIASILSVFEPLHIQRVALSDSMPCPVVEASDSERLWSFYEAKYVDMVTEVVRNLYELIHAKSLSKE